ncbi:MAG TPA: hypothetical protein VNT55_00350 [Baekduia sp.]|nr:hypothetical protein [Baekduia sp.]
MTRNRIIGAMSALALLGAPAVAVAHGNGHHHGRHHHKHHAKKTHSREVTGTASATIASYANGELTLALPSGKTYTADVTDRTIILCKSAPTTAAAKTASHGDDDGDGDDHGRHHGDDGSTTTPGSTSVPGSTTVPGTTHDHGDDGDHSARCGTEALVVGAKVSEAKLSLKGDTVIWKKVTVVK